MDAGFMGTWILAHMDRWVRGPDGGVTYNPGLMDS
jgi:hypothetical protein